MAKAAMIFGAGAEQGLGAALCRRFATDGYKVYALGRTAEKLDKVTGPLEGTALTCDVTNESAIQAAFATVDAAGDEVDVVIYNAGNNRFKPLLEMDSAFVENLWRLCALGGFLVGQHAIRRMEPRGQGTVLFTGATASVRARPPFTAFASAKAALRAFAHGMAREFGPKGIHIGHIIVDGMIDGDQLHSRFPDLKDHMGEDGMLDVDAMAEAYAMVHAQHRSAWTLELDLRPWKETF